MDLYQRPSGLPHYAQQTRHVNPMPVQHWSTVAGSDHQPFNTGQCFLLAVVWPQSTSWHRSNVSSMVGQLRCCWPVSIQCVHIVYTTPMTFKCCPASYIMTRHRTNVRYTDTLLGQWWARVHDYTITMLWNKAGLMLAPPSVTLAHIQSGAKHNTVTQYWAIVGSAS